FYQGFLRNKGSDPNVRHETARAFLRVGHIQVLLGRLNLAEGPYREALALLERLAAEFPKAPAFRSGLGNAHRALGALFSDHLLGRSGLALKGRLAALSITRQLAADFPSRPEFRRQMAYDLTGVGLAYSRSVQKPREGEKYLHEAVEAWQGLRK